MKKIIFVLLKIAEISLFPIAYCLLTYVGWLVINCLGFVIDNYEFWHFKHNFSFCFALEGILFSFFISGMTYFMVIFIRAIPIIISEWIWYNKKWSENISKWLKSRFS